MAKTKNDHPLAGEELVGAVIRALEDKLAEKIVTIDLRAVSGSADWFIICEGDNTAHTTAIANGVIDALRDGHAAKPWHSEGVEDGRWALLDYSDVVVHIMLPDVRAHYDLEGLWDVKRP